jgi:hypothetical protein
MRWRETARSIFIFLIFKNRYYIAKKIKKRGPMRKQYSHWLLKKAAKYIEQLERDRDQLLEQWEREVAMNKLLQSQVAEQKATNGSLKQENVVLKILLEEALMLLESAAVSVKSERKAVRKSEQRDMSVVSGFSEAEFKSSAETEIRGGTDAVTSKNEKEPATLKELKQRLDAVRGSVLNIKG